MSIASIVQGFITVAPVVFRAIIHIYNAAAAARKVD
jgi:hypothetical protein